MTTIPEHLIRKAENALLNDSGPKGYGRTARVVLEAVWADLAPTPDTVRPVVNVPNPFGTGR